MARGAELPGQPPICPLLIPHYPRLLLALQVHQRCAHTPGTRHTSTRPTSAPSLLTSTLSPVPAQLAPPPGSPMGAHLRASDTQRFNLPRQVGHLQRHTCLTCLPGPHPEGATQSPSCAGQSTS